MIDLYYWPTSNGRKITIALEELALPYTIIPVNMRNGDTTRPEFLRINPNGKIPAMIDHDVPGGLVLFESVVMLQYLAEKSGRLMPRDTRGRYDVLKWLVFQAASIGPLRTRTYSSGRVANSAGNAWAPSHVTSSVRPAATSKSRRSPSVVRS